MNGTHPIIEELKKEKGSFRYMILPLFEKMQRSDIAYWSVFLVVSFFTTTTIVSFIDSYSHDLTVYGNTISSVEFNRAMSDVDTNTPLEKKDALPQ